jgi:hypothetical protein
MTEEVTALAPVETDSVEGKSAEAKILEDWEEELPPSGRAD